MIKKFLILSVVLLSLMAVAFAQNETTNETVIVNETIVVNNTPAPEQIADFDVIGFSPEKVNVGDVIFNIQVQNTGNVELTNLVPIILGRGFSIYDVSSITSLKPNEKSTLHVAGHLTESGTILLNIKISNKIFYETVIVQTVAPVINTTDVAASKKAALDELALQLADLKKNYDVLEADYLKRKADYDFSEVDLTALKDYIRSTESNIATGDPAKANVSLTLALSEYADQKNNLATAPKKPFLAKLKDNVVLISTIAGSLLTLFALYELLKKKQESVYKRIKEIKITETKPKKKVKPKKK